MINKVTIKESIFISKSRELVWDYTQNYNNRSKWDFSVTDFEMIQETPNRIVKIKSPGKMESIFEYKLEERPTRTSLSMKNSNKSFLIGGGGSWHYEDKDGGTIWTQTNTMVLKDNLLFRILNPVFAFGLKYNTQKALKKAKKIIEDIK